ncbi:hypothetical protein NUW54_g12015 [Trametes sanguinea]|uniref:Uncharacterized protein n=1 Tax=Trametes sanguinea TaxID=158606 RepID=A0ACC1N503_9APHY|nr:hypothetical protein NUW54_g12015 [Trametes sanguinea]
MSSTSAQSPRIAIVGGGLAGLVLLLTLSRRGIPATLYERDADSNSRARLGGMLDLEWESGQRALRENGSTRMGSVPPVEDTAGWIDPRLNGGRFLDTEQVVRPSASRKNASACITGISTKADLWWLRHHPRVLALPFKKGVKRAEKANAIDLFVAAEPLEGSEKTQWESLFEEVPAPLTEEERVAHLRQLDGVACSSDAFFPFPDNVHRARRSGVRYLAAPAGASWMRNASRPRTSTTWYAWPQFAVAALFWLRESSPPCAAISVRGLRHPCTLRLHTAAARDAPLEVRASVSPPRAYAQGYASAHTQDAPSGVYFPQRTRQTWLGGALASTGKGEGARR